MIAGRSPVASAQNFRHRDPRCRCCFLRRQFACWLAGQTSHGEEHFLRSAALHLFFRVMLRQVRGSTRVRVARASGTTRRSPKQQHCPPRHHRQSRRPVAQARRQQQQLLPPHRGGCWRGRRWRWVGQPPGCHAEMEFGTLCVSPPGAGTTAGRRCSQSPHCRRHRHHRQLHEEPVAGDR